MLFSVIEQPNPTTNEMVGQQTGNAGGAGGQFPDGATSGPGPFSQGRPGFQFPMNPAFPGMYIQ